MPTRGSPGLSSCAHGCVATQSIIADTSRPSIDGVSIETMPPDAPKPRGAQVTTLYPASVNPFTNGALGSVSPAPAQPGPSRIVGAAPPPAAWNVCVTIDVPSNEVTVPSAACAAAAGARAQMSAAADAARTRDRLRIGSSFSYNDKTAGSGGRGTSLPARARARGCVIRGRTGLEAPLNQPDRRPSRRGALSARGFEQRGELVAARRPLPLGARAVVGVQRVEDRQAADRRQRQLDEALEVRPLGGVREQLA